MELIEYITELFETDAKVTAIGSGLFLYYAAKQLGETND